MAAKRAPGARRFAAATANYREESDTVRTFLAECTNGTVGVRTTPGAVSSQYSVFTEARGLRPRSDQR